MGRPKGSKNHFPRGARTQVLDGAEQEEATNDDSDSAQEQQESDGDLSPNEVSEDEARAGALTVDGRRLREKTERILKAKQTGRGKAVKLDLPPFETWGVCVKYKGIDRTRVHIERVLPGEADCGVYQIRNLPEYSDMVNVVKTRHWDGTEQTYKWTFRDSYNQYVAAGTFTLPEDPVQKVLWAQKGTQAGANTTQQQVPQQPQMQPMMPSNDPRIELMMKSIEHLSERLDRSQQMVEQRTEDQQQPSPPAAVQQQPQPPQGKWEWDGRGHIWRPDPTPPPPPQSPPPSPPPSWQQPPPWWGQQPPQPLPQQPQTADVRGLLELTKHIAATEGELISLKSQIKQLVDAQQQRMIAPQMAPWPQQPMVAQPQQMQPQAMVAPTQQPTVSPSTSSVIRETKDTVAGLIDLMGAVNRFGQSPKGPSASILDAIGSGGAEEAANKSNELPIKAVDGGGWQMFFNTETGQPIDGVSQVALNWGNITEGLTKVIGGVADTYRKMKESDVGAVQEKREMIEFMRQQKAENEELRRRLLESGRALAQATTFDSPEPQQAKQPDPTPPPAPLPERTAAPEADSSQEPTVQEQQPRPTVESESDKAAQL